MGGEEQIKSETIMNSFPEIMNSKNPEIHLE